MKSLNPSRPSSLTAVARRLFLPTAAALALLTAAQPAAMAQKKSAAPDKGGAKAATPSPSPVPEAAATPSASPASTAAASPPPAATPADPEAQKRLREGREAIVAAYYSKTDVFHKTMGDFNTAGGISTANLKSKEDIAARRQMLDAINTANEDMIAFLKTEPDILRAELGKVGMAPAKIDQYAADFTPDPKTETMLQARMASKDTFAALGEALTFLEESFGRWKSSSNGHLTFQKPADVKKYGAIISKVQKSQAAENAILAKLQAGSEPATSSPAPSAASPTASPAAAMPSK